MILMT